MSTTENEGVSPEVFRQMAERAGLGLTEEELERLRPLYGLYLEFVNQIHSVDLQAEEIALAFQPDWQS